MDPVSAAGLAVGVASIGLQVYTGCIQGIQLLITARNYPDDCKYLNLRLRMEQQRLFAWSETSGLLDLDDNGDMISKQKRVLESNTFVLHRTTVLDLLVQIQCLFKEFREQQSRHGGLDTASPMTGPDGKGRALDDDSEGDSDPERDAARANFPLTIRRRNFIRRAMASMRPHGETLSGSISSSLSKTGKKASHILRWVSLDKAAFELLLTRFSTLNDSMAVLLDARMQAEIHHAVQDTNRGVLLLHHRVADLGKLVMALNLKLEAGDGRLPQTPGQMQTQAHVSLFSPMADAHKAANQEDLRLLSELAKFKAFNGSIDDGDSMSTSTVSLDDATATCLGLGKYGGQEELRLDRSDVELDETNDGDSKRWTDQPSRTEAHLRLAKSRKQVWVEWKEYVDLPRPYEPESSGGLQQPRPPKEVIIERVHRLAALLNRGPKPAAFRTPHCLGYFDDNETNGRDDEQADDRPLRLGLVFERPIDNAIDPELPPISLRDLLRSAPRPSVTDRARLARDIASCVMHLHAVDWLHKGLRSHNIIFFRKRNQFSGRSIKQVNFEEVYLSGFDFSRPARPDEMTEAVPGGDVEQDFYRHPDTQSCLAGSGRRSFRKSFDIYSLGVVLVEIARWNTVDRILGADLAPDASSSSSDSPNSNYHQYRRRRAEAVVVARKARECLLADDMMAEVGAAMGDLYEEATKRCVEGGWAPGLKPTDEDETDDEVASRLSVGFYEGVVKKLSEIRI